jgi:hypothetical protein
MTRHERHSDALCANRRIAATGREECLVQRLLGLGIVCGKLFPSCTQKGALGEQRAAAGIGVDDAAACIEQQHARADPIEGVGQCRCFAGLQIDHIANQYRPTQMRRKKPHALARRLVSDAVSFVTKYDMLGVIRP